MKYDVALIHSHTYKALDFLRVHVFLHVLFLPWPPMAFDYGLHVFFPCSVRCKAPPKTTTAIVVVDKT